MKILLSYSFKKNAIPLGIHCDRALTNLGHKVIRHESTAVSPYDKILFKPVNKLLSNLRITRSQPIGKNSELSSIGLRNARLINAVKESKPDLIFIIRGSDFSSQTLIKIKNENKVKLVCWWMEGSSDIEKSAEKAPYYDFYFINSRYAVKEHVKQGIKNCFYLPLGADLEFHKKITFSNNVDNRYKCNIGFVGAWDQNRQNLLQNLTDFDNASILGPKWRKKNFKNKKMLNIIKGEGLYNEDIVNFFNTTKINININLRQNHNIPSGANLRTFEVTACGGFLLTDFVEELPELFRIPNEIEVFNAKDEFIDKIKYYLKNDSVREKIAENGFRRVIADHTYEIRMKQLLDIISGN
jgi:spore maturation protein CgeB